MKLLNSNKVPPSILAQIEDIWKMDDETLYGFIDDMWTFVPEEVENIDDFFGPDLMGLVRTRQNEIHQENERKRNATVVVEDVEYKTLAFFDMYNLGWECDTKGWVVDKDGVATLVLSDHGNPFFPQNGVDSLQRKIKELNNNIKALKSAVTLLEING